MKIKTETLIVSWYKILASLVRLSFGFCLLYFGSPLILFSFFFRKELIEDSRDFVYQFLTTHLRESSHGIVLFFALFLIIYSLIELFFAIGLLYNKKWSAVGLSVVVAIGVVFDLFFVSKLILAPRSIGIIIDLLIIGFLIRLLMNSKKYFR